MECGGGDDDQSCGGDDDDDQSCGGGDDDQGTDQRAGHYECIVKCAWFVCFGVRSDVCASRVKLFDTD